MTAEGGGWTTAPAPPTITEAPPAPTRAKIPAWLVISIAGFLLLVIVARITGASELTSSGAFGSALRLAIPIMLPGLGAVFAERAGIVNIGLEGMMIFGTWFGAWGAWQYGPWWGVALGIMAGALGGLLHAVATVTFNVDHIVSGVAINILALGAMRFASVITYTADTGGGSTQSPRVEGIDVFEVPVVGDVARTLSRTDIPVLSELGGLLGGFTQGLSWLTLLALLLIPLSFWVLWHTAWGLRLRSCGENPWAAESLGVPVYRMKYYGVVISGALAGLGGAFLVLVQAGIYREGQTGGRGFLGLAALIFGNWRPRGVFAGAALFGFADALRLRQQAAVHALLLLLALGLFLTAAWFIYRRRIRPAAISGAAAVGFLVWFLVSDTIPGEFLQVTPHITTLLVLSLAAQRLRMPAADGARYRKGEAH